MTTRQAKLPPDDLKKVAHIEVSIQHWSAEHTQAILRADALLENIKGLHQARSQILETAYKVAGIDPSIIQSIKIDKDGVIECACLPVEPVPEVSNSTPTITPSS
jgi:predicted transcriptional regulator